MTVLADGETVSETANGDQITRIRRIVFDLLPQPVDVYHDRVLVDNGLAPDDTVDHVLRENMVNVVDEQLDH